MRTALLALAIAALPAGLAAQDRASPYEEAVAARTDGDHARAVRLLEPWVAANPDDVDARVQLAYAYLALGKTAEARAQFDAVLLRAPDYTDARDGLELADRRGAGASGQGYAIVEASYADVDATSRDWLEGGIAVGLPIAGRDALELRGTWYRRFGVEDVEAAAQFTGRVGDDTWVRLGASVVPSADFRPSVGLNGGVDRRVVGGPEATVVGVDAAWQDYPAQDVVKVSPRVVQYLADGSLSLTARADAVIASDRVRFGGSLRGDWYGDDAHRLFVGGARGPDTELGIVTQTTSVFGGGELPLSADVTLTGSAAREWREGPADRTEVRLGVKFGW